MARMQFSSDGKLVGIDGEDVDYSESDSNEPARKHLTTSSQLEFLKEEKVLDVFDKRYWSLFERGQELAPLKFSNGKTQEDIVEDVVKLIEKGKKIIFLHGVCGTGKSAIALNIARSLGRASIVVPIKSLQKQYEEDYMGKKSLVKKNGNKLKIAMITGRDNHDSVIQPGVSCADPFLPDTIKITDKNYERLKEYYEKNPYIINKEIPPIKNLKRLAIAPANPHWSPILPGEIELNQLKDAKKKRYTGLRGREYVFYHRKPGCSYYDQYLAYLEADVIIFNSAKYLAEVAIGRKPETAVDIIDEADEFLDNLSNSVELNLTRLGATIKNIYPEKPESRESVEKILKYIDAEEKNKKALGIDEEMIFHLDETKIGDVLRILVDDRELEAEITLDDMNYANTAVEAARNFKDSFSHTYVSYRMDEENLFANLVTTNLAQKFKEIVDGSEALVLMSGTLHSPEIIKKVFGIEDFAVIEAETLNQGAIEIIRTGKEFDCKYSNFQTKKHSRKDYLNALNLAIKKSVKPTLVHVNSYSDLPNAFELEDFDELMTRENLVTEQSNDKIGQRVIEFKKGKKKVLFTTRCARGVDFPGKTCNSVIFTKFPNPAVNGIFWRIIQKTYPQYYWELYRDKARREFLQRIYRAVRSKHDHVFVLSPDLRVVEAVREMQVNGTL